MRRIRDVIFALLVALLPLILPEDRFFDSAGVRIRYLDRGEGEPVVLLHGFSPDAGIDWIGRGILDKLAVNHRVIAMDARGHGRSGKPGEDHAFGREMMEDIVRLLDHLRIDRVHLIGCSRGGRIALEFAAAHPGRIRSVVLIGAGEGGDPGIADAFATSWEQMEAIRAPVLAILRSADGFRADVDRLGELMPHLTTRVIEGADHVSILERPELLAAIEAFLDES